MPTPHDTLGKPAHVVARLPARRNNHDLPETIMKPLLVFSMGFHRPEGNEILEIIVTTPTGVELGPVFIRPGECHYPDPRSCDDESTSGGDGFVLEHGPPGRYQFRATLEGGKTFQDEGSRFSAGVYGWQTKEQSEHLRMNDVYWYQPDGSARFVEDGGYILLTPLTAFLMYGALVAWFALVIFLLGRAGWRLRHRLKNRH